MDELTHLHARLRELVEAKVARIAALKSEIAAIEHELIEAKNILGVWGVAAIIPAQAMPTPVESETPPAPPEDDFARRRRQLQEKRKAHVIKMPRHAVIDYLSAVGPQEPRRIMQHFGLTDGRGGAVFTLWANEGHLVKHADGRFAAAAPTTTVAPEPDPPAVAIGVGL